MQQDGTKLTSKCLEQPVANSWLLVWGECNLLGKAPEVFHWLCWHMVKVDEMATGVEDTEEQGCAGNDLVKLWQQRAKVKDFHTWLGCVLNELK